jgi:hypothetical protein
MNCPKVGHLNFHQKGLTMDLAELFKKLELHRQGLRDLTIEDNLAIEELVRSGLMLYGFIRAKSAGKNMPCERWERAADVGRVQHELEKAELNLEKEAV